MAYILLGTRDLLNYRRTLGVPCSKFQMAAATGIPMINFESLGRDKVSFTAKYGEKEAQNLAKVMGTTVANITANGGQILV